jgi:mRNA-degrading endonuclease RelE of RelBE toxin-antitoxin system
MVGKKQPFVIIYAPEVESHLKAIPLKFHSLIQRQIEIQLSYRPLVENKNRKPLKRAAITDETWEIRFGLKNQFRVFYEVDEKKHRVFILAIGVKRRNKLLFGKEDMPL